MHNGKATQGARFPRAKQVRGRSLILSSTSFRRCDFRRRRGNPEREDISWQPPTNVRKSARGGETFRTACSLFGNQIHQARLAVLPGREFTFALHILADVCHSLPQLACTFRSAFKNPHHLAASHSHPLCRTAQQNAARKVSSCAGVVWTPQFSSCCPCASCSRSATHHLLSSLLSSCSHAVVGLLSDFELCK